MQGFATGDLDADAYALRLFESTGMDLMLAQSYSKNMGLYGERIGFLSVVCKNPQDAGRVKSQIEVIIRGIYATPVRHGAALVVTVLKTPELVMEWKVLPLLSEFSDKPQYFVNSKAFVSCAL